MKTHIKALACTIMFAAVVTNGCKKDKLEEIFIPAPPSTPPVTGKYTSLSVLFNEIEAPVQTFTVNASSGGTITGSKGTQIIFQPNSFIDMNNQPVSGNVTIELREILSKQDMIFSNKTTSSYGYPLVSGGEFYIKAAQNGQELQLDWGIYYTITVPADTLLGMDVFYGTPADSTGGDLSWSLFDSTNNVTYQSSPAQYILSCSFLNWINCDWFPYGATFTNMTVNISNYSSFNDVIVYMYFNDFNSILPIWSSTNPFITTKAWENQNVTIVAVATNSDGNLFSSFSEVTLSQNMTINPTLSPTTKDDFIAQVNALP